MPRSARAVWSGSISFGLVTVPVKAYTAMRDRSVHFNQLETGTGARIRYRKVSEKTNKEVPAGKIESAYQLSPDHYVVVDEDEIDQLRPRTTRTIDVTDFVDLASIDPVYYDHTYWLAPDGSAADRAYRLLQAAMEQEGRAGIGTVVMRNKQYLAAVRPLEGALAMSTMRFADEVVPKGDIEGIPDRRSKPDAKQLKLATQIVESLSTEWDPAKYHDTYTEELRALIDQKAKGKKVVVEEAPEAETKVVDLMEALEASLAATRKGSGRRAASGSGRGSGGRSGGRSGARSGSGKRKSA